MEKQTQIIKLRIPASLMPLYRSLMSTPEGEAAMKRIRVDCGICKATKHYSIHRGITRVASVIACENCRHFYQKIRRTPINLDCVSEDKASCYREDSYIKTKCKACLAMRILDCCPHPDDIYENISKLLSDDCKKAIRGMPMLLEELSEDETGSVALEFLKNGSWVPAPPPDNDTSNLISNMEDDTSQHDSNSNDLSDEMTELDESSRNLSLIEGSENLVSTSENGDKPAEDIGSSVEGGNENKDECRVSPADNDSDQMDGTTSIENTLVEVENNEMATQNISEDDDEPSTKDSEEEEEEETASKGAADNIEEDLETGNGGNSNAELNSEITYKIATISSQAFEDAEIEEEEDEAMVDDPAPVLERIVTRRQKDSFDDENAQPLGKKSERIKRKRKKVEYFSKPVVTGGRKTKGLIHGPDGAILKNGKDLCDCLQEDCPGCHFPCPKCRSPKCGNECRVNRRWYYEKVEVEGTKIFWTNKFVP